jgi:hypothetical protein
MVAWSHAAWEQCCACGCCRDGRPSSSSARAAGSAARCAPAAATPGSCTATVPQRIDRSARARWARAAAVPTSCAVRRGGTGPPSWCAPSIAWRVPHWMGMPERDRDETVAAAPAAATSLVIRRTSDQILQSRCRCLWGARRRCPCRTPASRRMAL